MNAPLKARPPKAQFVWDDPLLLGAQLNEDERLVRDAAHAYCQDKLAPRILEAFRQEKTDPAIFREMGEMGLLGPTIPEQYGGPGLNNVAYGLIAREVERVDSGYRSMMSVQSSLVMLPIYKFGTEAQRQKFLPRLARGEWIGCFGLTEPDHGSDPGSLQTRARKVPGGYRLTGAKMWISNSPIADVFLVWAKDDEGHIRGFILEKASRDFPPRRFTARWASRPRLRAKSSWTRCSARKRTRCPRCAG
jgi:glutaryl-CoA dehydrogenase